MRRRIVFLASAVLLLASMAFLGAAPSQAAVSCENQICESATSCRPMQNAICLNDAQIIPCEWDVCTQ